MKALLLSILVLSVVCLNNCPAVLAQEPAPEPTKEHIQSDETEIDMEGHIEKETMTAESGLKDLATSLQHLKRAAIDILTEVERQDMVVVGEPDVIGPMIIPAMPNPTGTVSSGRFLPPRKKFIDYFMIQIDHLMPIVEKSAEAVTLPESATTQAKADKARLGELVTELNSCFHALDKVTAGPKYDNMAIARQATAFGDLVKKIDRRRKSLYKSMKKDLGQAKSTEKKLRKEVETEKKKIKDPA
ncbi:MAG: hypothetical protein KC777_14815 [Cyanobacteria bacterium HKST-UBA02]|nr:hypothetical protein [Cyanobacteria bacterium HKST-UBA02]